MAYNTIMLKGENPNIEELVANAAITPGMILELYTTKVRKHASPDGTVKPIIVALEDELQGGGIDDDYDANSVVRVWHPKPGDQFYGLLADGEDVDIGDKLASNGDGYLKKMDGDSVEGEICGVAREARDRTTSSGGGDAEERIIVEAV